MSEEVNQIIEKLKTLSLLETSDLIKKIEEVFGVDASATRNETVTIAAAPVIEEIEEKTEFNVVLEEVPSDKKIPILKVVRTLTGLGLKEVKKLVESAPETVQENVSKEAAETAKKQLEDAGAKVALK